MIKIKYKFPAFAFGLSLLLISCNINDKTASEAEEVEVLPEDIVELREDQAKLAGIEFGKFEMKSIGNVIKTNGVISVPPQNLATVSMPLGGFIKSTNLLPGNAVSRGQVLAIIENQEFVDIQQNYLEAKNRLVFAKAEYERHTNFYKDDVYSEKNVQQVTVEYKNLQAVVRSLEQKLTMIGINPDLLTEENISSSVSLRSPIKGFLKSVNVNIGKYVSTTDVLFEIVNSDNLYLELTLFEKDAEKVSTGQKVKFFVNNGSEVHEAIIIQAGKSVDDDKTFKVFATVTGQCDDVLPGMYVNALIEESAEQIPTLPSEAIVSFDDKDYIFVFEKEKEGRRAPFTEYKLIEVRRGSNFSGFYRCNPSRRI
ncbi:MAG: efflux RND transporter periplasmic adaptor subunit [Bacteroidales bacterium]|nr:efflux RND transporter periplasmic adaptor subunit [Bacteroidales bacterium]